MGRQDCLGLLADPQALALAVDQYGGSNVASLQAVVGKIARQGYRIKFFDVVHGFGRPNFLHEFQGADVGDFLAIDRSHLRGQE